jgi:phage FluMu protein gp41
MNNQERKRLAEQTISDTPSVIYSSISDESRKNTLTDRQKKTGLSRLSVMVKQLYERHVSKRLKHRWFRRLCGLLHHKKALDYVNLVATPVAIVLVISGMIIPLSLIHNTDSIGFMIMCYIIPLMMPSFIVFLIPYLTNLLLDQALLQSHITTHIVHDDQQHEHTVIVSTMTAKDTAQHLGIPEASLEAIGHSYSGTKYDTQPLTIWSPTPLTEDQIGVLSERDAITMQRRLSSLDVKYDIRHYQQVSKNLPVDERSPVYDQCVALIIDNRRMIDHLDQQSLREHLNVVTECLSDANTHGLNMSSTITLRELERMRDTLQSMNEKLLILNEDYTSIHDAQSHLSLMNRQIDNLLDDVALPSAVHG